VMPRYGPGGGIVRIVRETARRLTSHGYQIEVFTAVTGEATAEAGPNSSAAVTVRQFPYGRSRRVHFPLLVGLDRALSDCNADVIHAHNHRYGHVLQAARVAHRRQIPLVVSTYYHPAQRRETLAKKGAIRMLDIAFGLVAYERAGALVALTRHEAELLRRFAPSPPIHVVPPGIDVSVWGNAAADLPVAGLPPAYFLYAGRIARTKGIEHLLSAVARIPPAVRRPLLLVGPDMGAREPLEARARALGIARDVRFLGLVPDDRTYRGIVRHASALILPSEWESFGIVLLEAMAARTPVIGSRVGAIPEVLDEGRAGRLVDYGDAQGLAEALTAVEGEPAATRLQVAHAFDRASALDWETATDRLRAVYEGVVHR